jgi:hypothetical protein
MSNLAWWCGSLVRLYAYIRLAQAGASWRKASYWPESTRWLKLGAYKGLVKARGQRCPAYIRLARVGADRSLARDRRLIPIYTTRLGILISIRI